MGQPVVWLGPTDMPDGSKWALVADPEDHVIGLFGH
jgi:hypothetical protein